MVTFDLGFLGGGQLARMSIQAAQRMGLRCVSLDPSDDSPASQIAPAVRGRLHDVRALTEVLGRCEFVTLENEFIPAEAIAEGLDAAGRTEDCLIPGLATLATIQDKLRQREALHRAGVPSPAAWAYESALAWQQPCVLKTRFGGYDGKGTRYALSEAEWAANVTGVNSEWLVEDFVPFRRELAVMVFVDGTVSGTFPTMETVQTRHVCDLVFPVLDQATDAHAREVALSAVRAVGGRGLFGVELFDVGDGTILVNEIAPRPHNTGHYTLDWGGISQFEQHVRCAMRLSLEPTPTGEETCMANLLGVEGTPNLRAATAAALQVPGVYVHWYGKSEMRAGRKMGHINAVGPSCRERAVEARRRFLESLA